MARRSRVCVVFFIWCKEICDLNLRPQDNPLLPSVVGRFKQNRRSVITAKRVDEYNDRADALRGKSKPGMLRSRPSRVDLIRDVNSSVNVLEGVSRTELLKTNSRVIMLKSTSSVKTLKKSNSKVNLIKSNSRVKLPRSQSSNDLDSGSGSTDPGL